jgi:hypothetical protein
LIRRYQAALAAYEIDAASAAETTRAHAVRLVRRCLCCLVKFDSEWAGERICGRCKGSTRWRTGFGD